MGLISAKSDFTLGQLLSPYSLSVDLKTILDYKLTGKTSGVSNWDRIQRRYSDDELSDNITKYNTLSYDSILIKAGTSIELYHLHTKRDSSILVPREAVQTTSFRPFIASEMVKLLRDPTYSKIIDGYNKEQLSLMNNEVTVYLWSRSLTPPGDNSQQGGWINISSFIELQSVNNTFGSGSFFLSVSPVMCSFDKDKGWIPTSISGYNTGNVGEDMISETSIIKNSDDVFERSNIYLNSIVQENDLVFIKFERIAKDVEDSNIVGGIVNEASIANKVWDMIGLVDTCQISTKNNDISISIRGRDLMKSWIEDGSYFFPSQLAQNIFSDSNSILTKRNLMEGISNALVGYAVSFKSIELMLKFIYNKFSNIGLVPDSVFSGYGERAIKSKYQLRSTQSIRVGNQGEIIDQLNKEFLDQDRSGIWQIIELVFDPSVNSRILADAGITHDQGSILNTANKLCQSPFVELYGDTYGDKFYFIIRKPPTDTLGYRGMVYDQIVSENILSDNSLKIDDGKLKQKLRDRIERERSPSNANNRDNPFSELVITVSDSEVLSDDLGYHPEAYSWYRLVPKGYGLLTDLLEFRMAPAVPFDEYAKVWGNKPLMVESNYLPSDFVLDSKYKNNLNYLEGQIFYDLQYIIQSNQYLPFTRTGRIVLTGNRLIKKGLFIYYSPTKEVFHVDSVNHTRSVVGNVSDRKTILTVSRGMRESFIKGKMVEFPSGEKMVSYFDIINTTIDNNASINETEFLKNWRVDVDIFNFFLQRRQWE